MTKNNLKVVKPDNKKTHNFKDINFILFKHLSEKFLFWFISWINDRNIPYSALDPVVMAIFFFIFLFD